MLYYLTLIFSCQLLGELVVQFLGLPLPGPVIGMVVLFLFLVIRSKVNALATEIDSSGVPVNLAKVGDGLLSSLSLLFVPAGVGVMVHFSLLKDDWLPLSVAVIVSTLLTIVITSITMVAIEKYFLKKNNPHSGSLKSGDGDE